MGEFCMGPADADCPDGTAPTCLAPDIVVTTSADESDGGPNNTDPVIANGGTGTSLREALILAANLPGPHHITFDVTAGDPGKVFLADDLPSVPAFTYLDGGQNKTRMRPRHESHANSGLIVSKNNVVIGNMHIAGFPNDGINIKSGASSVNMFHVSIGEQGYPNLNGLYIEQGTNNITLGRGRELPCIPPVILSQGSANPDYDVNLILANEHNGIFAQNSSKLRIYGTWVGFTNDNSLCEADTCGNGWVGIHLKEVNDAVIGVQETDAEYQVMDIDKGASIGPAFVAVGRSGAGGIKIDGGGEISMQGVMLGDTPNMVPYAQNSSFGLKIMGNTGPVSFGARVDASGRQAEPFGLIYTEDARPITIESNQSTVEIFRTQVIALPDRPQAEVGLFAKGGTGSIYLKHLSFTLNPTKAAIQFDGPQTDTQVINCLFWTYSYQDIPVFYGNGLTYPNISIRNNMQYGFRQWSERDYPHSSENFSSGDDPLEQGIWANNARPISPDSPLIDMGEDLDIDMNGEQEGLYNGCGPEIGAFECTSDECLNASCD